MTEEVKKNSKFVKYITSYDDNSDSNDETEYNEKKDLDDMMMDNDQMLVNIQKDLLEFINNKSLPLCEYLTINKIEKFLSNEILY